MLKVLGSIIILACGTTLGVTSASKLSSRINFFDSYLKFVTFTQNQIKYSTDSLGGIIKKFDAGGMFEIFLRSCIEKMNEGLDFNKSWYDAIDKVSKSVGLSENEVDLVKDFGNGLGISDVETQVSHCQLHKNLVSDRLSYCVDEKKVKSKLYVTLGVSISIALVLVII